MFPLIARFAALMVAGRLFGRVLQHPRLAPIVNTRKGRLALLVLGFGLRRHSRTRYIGHAVRLARRSHR
jgi:hypothetical protein